MATFLLLDLCTLAFGYSISTQVERDAIAINLAGRQRMLSQRITKAALLATNPQRSPAQRADSRAELLQADHVFRQTLSAFSQGGEAVGGDGRSVLLESVQGKAALLVGEVHGLLNEWPEVPSGAAELEKFSLFMTERNSQILENMNELTSELERESITSVARLRVAQTLAFLLSLVNFLFILRGMSRARSAAENASSTDALTGLLNRGGLYRQLAATIEDSPANNIGLGVMMLDLNDFKAVNDNFGHAAGDAALREVARRLKGFCAQGWSCGRLGGDEFAVICPGVSTASLAEAAQQLTHVLGGVPGGTLTVSASVGWATLEPGQTADQVIALADANMYAVKRDRQVHRSFRQKQR